MFHCDQNGPPARRSEPDWRLEGAYLNGYVTDEQRSRRPIFIATLRAVASWLFFRVARSLRIDSRYARRNRQSGSDRLEKQPTDLRRNICLFRGQDTVSKGTHGFVLWEIMLALTIFCVVAIALTTALHQTVDASILLRDESQVRLELQNLLTETATLKLKPGKSVTFVGDGRVRYETEVRAVQAKTASGVLLPNLYEISVQASWKSSGQDRSGHAELVVYQP
jgi:hypothetical protein